MDTNNHKSVAIDIETYEILKRVADHECRTVGGQIRWLIKQMPMLADLKPMSPALPIRRKKKATAMRAMSTKDSYTSKILEQFATTRATMCKDDFDHVANECDPSKILSTLCHRGDLERIGTSGRPYYYHITPQGIRSHNGVMARRAA